MLLLTNLHLYCGKVTQLSYRPLLALTWPTVNRRLIARGNPPLDITSFLFQQPFEDFNFYAALCPAVKDDKGTVQKHKYFLNARHSAAIWAHVHLSGFSGLASRKHTPWGRYPFLCAIFVQPSLFVIKMKCILN